MQNRELEVLSVRAARIWDVESFSRLDSEVADIWCSSEADMELLTKVGFPQWAAPNMYFEFEDSQLRKKEGFRCFGEDRDDRQLLVEIETGQLFVLTEEDGRLFLASDFLNLFELLIIYGEFVERCIDELSSDRWEANDVPKQYIDNISAQGKAVSERAFETGGFWAQEIDRLAAKRDEYR